MKFKFSIFLFLLYITIIYGIFSLPIELLPNMYIN